MSSWSRLGGHRARWTRCRTGRRPSGGRSTRRRNTSSSSTLERVDWNAELLRGDLEEAVRELKREPGEGLYVGGPAASAGAGGAGTDRRVRVHRPTPAGRPRPDAVRGALQAHRPEARRPARVRLGGDGDALRAGGRRPPASGRPRAGERLGGTGATGLEPATSGVTGRRSNQLSYPPSEVRGLSSRGAAIMARRPRSPPSLHQVA